jgi:ABC-2 type transport system permease protein
LAKKQHSVFRTVAKWELQEYVNSPVLEFIIIAAMASILIYGMQSSSFLDQYHMLYYGPKNMFLFLSITVSVVFSRSFSGSFNRGEVKMLLSYPIERWKLFVAKYIVLFAAVFLIFAIIFSCNIYLLSLSIFEPLVYVSLLAIFVQLFIASTIAVAIAVLVKNEVVSVLASMLLLFGIDSFSADIGGSLTFLSASERFGYLFGYFGQLTKGANPISADIVTVDTISLSILVPVCISIFLLIFLYMYFTRFMEVD